MIWGYDNSRVLKCKLDDPWCEEGGEETVSVHKEASVDVEDDGVRTPFEIFRDQDCSFDLVGVNGLVTA